MQEDNLISEGVPWFVGLLHSLPHVDFNFKPTNSSFNLDSAKYKESLLMWCALPVAWLLLTLLVFLVYFCLRCCQLPQQEKTANYPILQWTIIILGVFVSILSAVGFYANENTKKGANRVTSSLDYILHSLFVRKNQVLLMERSINQTFVRGIIGAKSVFRAHPELDAKLSADLFAHTDRSLQHLLATLRSIQAIDDKHVITELDDVITSAREYEFVRWVITLVLFNWLLLLSLVLLVGAGKSSRCLLLIFCSCGIFSLVVCWLWTAAHLPTSIGIADFCSSSENLSSDILNQYVEKDIFNYYVKCDAKNLPNYYKLAFQRAHDGVRESQAAILKAIQMAYQFISVHELSVYSSNIYTGLNDTSTALIMLTALVECTNIHKDLQDALHGLCQTVLPGLLLISMATMLTGIILTTVVLLASKSWRNFILDDDDEGPGLMCESNACSTFRRTSQPPSYTSDSSRLYSILRTKEMLPCDDTA